MALELPRKEALSCVGNMSKLFAQSEIAERGRRMTLCECGCGQEVKYGNKFIHGHNMRLHHPMKNRDSVKKAVDTRRKHKGNPIPEPQLCECGCGEYAKPGKRFISGHNGRKRVPEPTLCECGCGEYANPGKRFIWGHGGADIQTILKNKPVLNAWETKNDSKMSINKECSSYLGCYIAERVLIKMFKNVQVMPYGNAGYDFLCGRGYRADVKSCATGDIDNGWMFHIRKNKTANIFVLLAFNNRDDLIPEHIWIIPGHIINHLTGLNIRKATIDKYSQYEQPIDNVVECCNELKHFDVDGKDCHTMALKRVRKVLSSLGE